MKRALLLSLLVPTTALAQPKIEPTGELRTNLVMERVDDLYTETPDAEPSIYLNVSRAIAGASVRFTDAISAKVTIDVRETRGTATYATAGNDEVTINNTENAYEVRAFDAYGQWRSASAGDFTFGIQKSSFGVRRSYDGEDDFYFGSMTRFQSFAVRSGVIYPRVLGLSWHKGFGDRVDATLMASNTTIFTVPDPRNGKDVSAVVEYWALPDVLRFTGSGMVGPRGEPGDAYETTQIAWSGAAYAKVWKLRALGEVFSRYLGEQTGLGYHVNLGGDVGLSGALDHLELLGRYESWEPDFEVDSDGFAQLSGASNLYWASPEGSTVMTGLLYEVVIPQDLNQAIAHNAFLQARLKF